MSEDELYRDAMRVALQKLRARDRFEAEVRLFLAEFPSPVADRVINFLKDRRIIDDTKTTSSLIGRNSGKRSVGLEKLRTELLERGAPEETVNAALGDQFEGERHRMLELLTAKFLPEANQRAKAARFLFSRGFPEEEIEGVLDRFFQT